MYEPRASDSIGLNMAVRKRLSLEGLPYLIAELLCVSRRSWDSQEISDHLGFGIRMVRDSIKLLNEEGYVLIENRRIKVGLDYIEARDSSEQVEDNSTRWLAELCNYVKEITGGDETWLSTKPRAEKVRKLVKQRPKTTLDDFKVIAAYKLAMWRGDAEKMEYFRFDTLYRSVAKFNENLTKAVEWQIRLRKSGS